MIDVDPSVRSSDKVSFEPFVGVAPSIYIEAFRATERKRPDGTVVTGSTARRTEAEALRSILFIDREHRAW